MSFARFVSFSSFASLALVASFFASGCGVADATSTCDAALDCGSLNKAQYDACIVDAQRYEIQARKTGCDAQFQAAVDCSDAEGICSDGKYTAYTCDKEWGSFKACADDP
jgi:hypothetical protein